MPVITLEEAKLHLRIDGNDENTLITAHIDMAEERSENYTHLTLLTKIFELVYDSVGSSIEIVKSPLQQVVKIETINSEGVKSEVSPSIYIVDVTGQRGRVQLKPGYSWPTHRNFASFLITVKAGYGDAAEDVPGPIREAIKHLITQVYENRGDAKADEAMPAIAASLLWPYRVFRL